MISETGNIDFSVARLMISDELVMIRESATCDERYSEELVARNRLKSLWYTARKTHSLEAPGRLRGRSGRLQGGSGEVPGGSRRLRGGSGEALGGSARVQTAPGWLRDAPGSLWGTVLGTSWGARRACLGRLGDILEASKAIPGRLGAHDGGDRRHSILRIVF